MDPITRHHESLIAQAADAPSPIDAAKGLASVFIGSGRCERKIPAAAIVGVISIASTDLRDMPSPPEDAAWTPLLFERPGVLGSCETYIVARARGWAESTAHNGFAREFAQTAHKRACDVLCGYFEPDRIPEVFDASDIILYGAIVESMGDRSPSPEVLIGEASIGGQTWSGRRAAESTRKKESPEASASSGAFDEQRPQNEPSPGNYGAR